MEYPYLKAWDIMAGSTTEWIETNQVIAKKENAPKTAIFRTDDGGWVVFEDLNSQSTIDRLNEIMEHFELKRSEKHMKRSETFASFAKAFAQFQGEVENPSLNKENPHFRSRYADLAEVSKVVRPILSKYGLSFYQDVFSVDDKVSCVTTLFHESGEFLESSALVVPAGRGGKPADAQGIGSAASYAKRYQLQAVCGIAAEDDLDGEDLAGHNNNYQVPPPPGQQPQHEVFTKPQLAAKYQLGMGSREGFEEYYNKMITDGKNHTYINQKLDQALANKKQQQTQQA